MRVALAVAVIAALAAGCDDNGQKFSRSDVEGAFHSQGFDLTAPLDEFSTESPGAFSGVALVPTRGSFVILVYDHNSDADDAFKIFRSQATSQTFDTRKANVVVYSDEGVTAPMRKRIRAALEELD
jgi:hypothetical protein